MIKIKLSRIPTGISSFDTIIRGGFPSGSLVLLTGDAGAGNTEFAYTSAVMLSILNNNQQQLKAVKEQLESLLMKDENLKLPESVCYISFVHSKEDILTELGHSFSSEFAATLSDNMLFKDLSLASMFPAALRSIDEERELLNELISVLDSNAPNNLVIIDSLNSLFRTCSRLMNWHDSISFLEDLQRRAKKWNGLVYLLLGRGIFDSTKEEEIMDTADGVLVFEWFREGFSRQQTMYIQKFRGVMPHIARDYIARFDTMVTYTDGYVVTNIKHIFGRK